MAVRPSISHYARALRGPLKPLQAPTAIGSFGTERLRLRPLQADDAYEFHECCADERYARAVYATFRSFNRFEEVQDHIAHTLEVANAGYCLPWSIRLAEDDRFVGFLNLCCPAGVPDRRRLNLEFGIDPRWWGHGYGSEALAGAIAHVFTDAGSEVNKIEGYCTASNLVSSRSMQRAGMRLVAVFEEHVHHEGRFHDALVHAILRREFIARRQG